VEHRTARFEVPLEPLCLRSEGKPGAPRIGATPTPRGRPSNNPDGPRGPADVTRAVVAAATDLFAARGIKGVGVREVADAAGVNPGLVYRYCGTKEDLLRAVIASFTSDLDQVEGSRTSEMSTADTQDLMALRQRVIARALLEGHHVDGLATGSITPPSTGASIDELRSDGHQAQIRALQVLALSLGWSLFEPFLLSITGLCPTDHHEAASAVWDTGAAIDAGVMDQVRSPAWAGARDGDAT
jgi:TetR/AcrR family transcriptional regulator, repressor for neighboring sulfatase